MAHIHKSPGRDERKIPPSLPGLLEFTRKFPSLERLGNVSQSKSALDRIMWPDTVSAMNQPRHKPIWLDVRRLMQSRTFNILAGLAALNLVVFCVCYASAADTGASFGGLIPAMICHVCLFASLVHTGISWSRILSETGLKHFEPKSVLCILLAVAPLLFYVAVRKH